MKIEAIKLKNFKAFKDVEMRDIPRFCVLVGANGTGKTTLFHLFSFLQEAMRSDVNTALVKLGGSFGFQEVRSRESKGNIGIYLEYREEDLGPLYSYSLEIGEKDNRAFVVREALMRQKPKKESFWYYLDFKNGKGSISRTEDNLGKEAYTLKSPDILAIKGLSQFLKYPALTVLGTLIENWYISDFHINQARQEADAGFADHLSSEGENISLVTDYLYNNHRKVFDKILDILVSRVPGISKVEAKVTEEGKVILKFTDKSFPDKPFLSRYVSDGTLKMFAYLVLLYDPEPHPLLCVEEPENQLYPKLLAELAEEFRSYANRGGQVFVSSHSPDFLNAIRLDEVFWLVKQNGYTSIKRARDDEQLKAFMDAGDQMGYLWNQGFLEGVDPQ